MPLLIMDSYSFLSRFFKVKEDRDIMFDMTQPKDVASAQWDAICTAIEAIAMIARVMISFVKASRQ